GFRPSENTPQVFYQLYFSPDFSSDFRLSGFYGGDYHVIGSGPLDMSGTHNYKICAVGSTISAYRDGVLLASGTDTGIPTGGYQAFAPSNLVSSSTIDNLTITPSKTVTAGEAYAPSGTFTDFDSTSWTATVDYGEGAGPQSLSLSGTNFA